jgi:hypothetical protein
MATNSIRELPPGSFLLELLHWAGWRLQVRDGNAPTIRAERADVALEVTGTSLSEAAGIVFARAMRSGRGSSASA